jgi:hypothetical protein
MAHSRIALIVIGVLLIAQAAAPQLCLGQPCTGKYKGGLTPSPAELAKILKLHAKWLNAGGRNDSKLAKDPRRANLCQANLDGADLDGADLMGANMSNARLTNANLNRTFLNLAILNRANLAGTGLNGAILAGAQLNGAILSWTHLYRAELNSAQLNGADLYYADLTDARLFATKVSKTNFSYTSLTNVLYAPSSEPPDPYVAGIKGLATINTAPGEEIGLIQLRKLLQDAGLRDNARAATFSIQRNITAL